MHTFAHTQTHTHTCTCIHMRCIICLSCQGCFGQAKVLKCAWCLWCRTVEAQTNVIYSDRQSTAARPARTWSRSENMHDNKPTTAIGCMSHASRPGTSSRITCFWRSCGWVMLDFAYDPSSYRKPPGCRVRPRTRCPGESSARSLSDACVAPPCLQRVGLRVELKNSAALGKPSCKDLPVLPSGVERRHGLAMFGRVVEEVTKQRGRGC